MTSEELTAKMEELANLKSAYAIAKRAFDENTEAAVERMHDLEAEITAIVLEKGETVKSEHISAVWNKGKTTWDGKLLEGYAVAHPEILAAKKVGKPTVSFRLAKGE